MVKVSVCRPLELGSAEITLWHSLQRQNPALNNAFLTPEFARVMSRRMPKIRVAVIEDDNRIIGFLAFEQLGLRVGRALCYGLADAQGVITAPGQTLDMPRVLQACGIDIWEFDHLVGDQVALFAPRQCLIREAPVVDLAQGYEQWLEGRKADKRIKQIFQRERKLERECGSWRFHFDSRNRSDLETLMAWKSRQYVRTGRKDRLAQSWFSESVFDLFETRSEHFSMVLSSLCVKDKPIAFHLTLCSNNVMSGWIPAYDTDYSAYGPGLILRLNLLKGAAENQIRVFDSGAGDHEYKSIFSTRNLTVATGLVARPSVASYARRLQTFPARFATDVVLANPRLRVAARETLSWLGTKRAAITGSTHTDTPS